MKEALVDRNCFFTLHYIDGKSLFEVYTNKLHAYNFCALLLC